MKILNSIYLAVCLSFVTINLSSQNQVIKDPLLNFKNFYEVSFLVGGSRINTNHASFTTPSGTYNFKKNSYLLSQEATFNYGWFFVDEKRNEVWTLKTGFNVLLRSADLFDNNKKELRLTTNYLQIPVQFGFREPLKFNTVKNNLYRAFDFNIGFYVNSPLYQKLDHPSHVDARLDESLFNYLRFGFIAEIALTAFNQNGYGHKIGIRATSDFAKAAKFGDTKHQLYPSYHTIGVFYNILNKRFKSN